MPTVNVKASYAGTVHSFTLVQPGDSDKDSAVTFSQLCDALVHQLDLSISVEDLENQAESPLRIWAVDKDRNYTALIDTESLSEALQTSPSLLRLRLRAAEQPIPSMETATALTSNNTSMPTIQPPNRASTATLLRIYHHLHTHASSVVAEALDSVHDALRDHPDDAALLRDTRHRLTALFASFLHHLHSLPSDYRISRKLLGQLIDRFTAIADETDLSEDTLNVILDAIRATTACRFAVSLIRTKYAQLVPEDDAPVQVSAPEQAPALVQAPTPETVTVNNPVAPIAVVAAVPARVSLPRRPLKHYTNQFARLLQIAGPDVKAAKNKLDKSYARLVSKGVALPELTVNLCRSMEKTVFHIARFHVAETDDGDCAFEEHTIVSLGSSVSRKLTQAGFPDRYAKRAATLATTMAKDDSIVEVVVQWAKKKISQLTSPAAPFSPVSLEPRQTSRVTDPSTASGSVEPHVRSGAKGSRQSRTRSRSPSRLLQSESQTGSRLEEAESISDRLVDFRDEPYGSNVSNSFEETRSGKQENGNYRNERRERFGSQVSADEPPFGAELDPNPYDETPIEHSQSELEAGILQDRVDEGSIHSSDDTSRSQWARIEMEKDEGRGTGRSRGRRRHGASRERSPSPKPPHHGYGRGSQSYTHRGSADRRSVAERSVKGASVRSESVKSESVRSASVRMTRTTGAEGAQVQRSAGGSARQSDSIALGNTHVDSIDTNETLHSDDSDDDGAYEPIRRGRASLLANRARSGSPYPR